MFCKSCGRQIDNDSTFCSFCGTKQSTDLKPQVQADTNQSINTTQKVYSNETNFNNTPNIVRQPKYDPTYKKEDDAMTVGIILLVIALIFAFVGSIKFEDRESLLQFRAITAIVSLILQICITVWVVNIAKRQNRETFGWGLFAFLLPSIALIVIATRKKLFANVQVVEGLDNEQNSKILSDKAEEFYNDNKYSESIRFSEKALDLNPENETAKEILQKSKVAFAETKYKKQEFKNDKNIFVKYETDKGEIAVLQKRPSDSPDIGNEVLQNGKPISNEKFRMGFMWYLYVENGKVVKVGLK